MNISISNTKDEMGRMAAEAGSELILKAAEDPVTPELPASILQKHPDCRLFFDKQSAQKLRRDD